MKKLFVSYTTSDRRDVALARRIDDVLRGRGVDVFLAERTIAPGEAWKQRLANEIDVACSHFLIIVSAASAAAEWVAFEIERARRRAADDDAFRVLTLLTGRVANPFPDLHTLPYHDDYQEQIEAIGDALGLPRLTEFEKVFAATSGRGNRKRAGSLASRLCDRVDQEKRFRSAFERNVKHSPAAPQLYVVIGDEGESHASLVERFRATFLASYAAHVGGAANPALHTISWPASTRPHEAEEELLASVFGEFDPAYRYEASRPLTPAAFDALTRLRPERVIALQHAIYVSDWHPRLPDVLDAYVRFWDGVAGKQPEKQFLIFFNVNLSPSAADESAALRRAVERLTAADDGDTAAPATRRIRTSALPQLRCVRKEDVDDWFDQRMPDFTWDSRQRVCDELFAPGDCRRMVDVERRLKAVYQEYAGGSS